MAGIPKLKQGTSTRLNVFKGLFDDTDLPDDEHVRTVCSVPTAPPVAAAYATERLSPVDIDQAIARSWCLQLPEGVEMITADMLRPASQTPVGLTDVEGPLMSGWSVQKQRHASRRLRKPSKH